MEGADIATGCVILGLEAALSVDIHPRLEYLRSCHVQLITYRNSILYVHFHRHFNFSPPVFNSRTLPCSYKTQHCKPISTTSRYHANQPTHWFFIIHHGFPAANQKLKRLRGVSISRRLLGLRRSYSHDLQPLPKIAD